MHAFILMAVLSGAYNFAFAHKTVVGRGSRHNDTVGTGDWGSALARADQFVAQLNITEKVNMITGAVETSENPCVGNILGIERLNFSGLCLSDGPASVNRADLISVFPAGLTAAATWDKDLMYSRGYALGQEFRDKGVHIALGPVAGPLGRHPLGGRNWEGFSPDPYLAGMAMNATIQGIQDAGVQAVSKHYIGNEQETQRSNTTSANGTIIEAISSNIDDRTFHELYLWPFADAVRAGTASIMCSYNRVNQTYACENDYILNDILKKELGFQGYVMSDWFATHSGAKSVNAGLDMSMPGPATPSDLFSGETYFGSHIVDAVNKGVISIDRLDDMVRRIMAPYFWLGQDENFPTVDPSTLPLLGINSGYPLSFLQSYGIDTVPARDVRGNHSALIRRIGAAGTVLLKNVNSTLPLKSTKNIGVFGNDAADMTDGLTFPDPAMKWGFNIGTLDIGGGSGSGRHTTLVSPLEAIKAHAKETGGRVQYITSNEILAKNDFHSIYPVVDVCLVFLKTWATENVDRLSFEADWNSTLVVQNVASWCTNTVVITHSGGVNTMPWASNPNVTAILAAHYPGEETGNSIVDVLWGEVNPSGKLPYTIPKTEDDYDIPIVNLTNVTSPTAWQANFTEGLLIDYRHFDAHNITPLYEFGYGLSYTTFDLTSPLNVTPLLLNPSSEPDPSRATMPGGNPDLWTPLLSVVTKVSNIGPVAGHTVVQLYVSFPENSVPLNTPVQVLRGFEKVYLAPGEVKDVMFELRRRDISYWDTSSRAWHLPKGTITIRVGFSSRDLRKETLYAVVQG